MIAMKRLLIALLLAIIVFLTWLGLREAIRWGGRIYIERNVGDFQK
jgi:hypothetical protein